MSFLQSKLKEFSQTQFGGILCLPKELNRLETTPHKTEATSSNPLLFEHVKKKKKKKNLFGVLKAFLFFFWTTIN
jgi:hypothetical protein